MLGLRSIHRMVRDKLEASQGEMLGLRPIYRMVRDGRVRVRLAALPPAVCDTGALGAFDEPWLAKTFADERIAAAWAEDGPRLDALDLPEETGGVYPGDQRALYYLALRLRPRALLEIGTHIGRSTAVLALAAARNRAEGIETTLFTVDIRDVNDPVVRPWLNYRSARSPRAMVEALGCSDFVRFEVALSLRRLARDDRRYGLIFLDGCHNADVVYQEIPLALRRLEQPGLIVLHDYFPGGRPLWPDKPVAVGPDLAVGRLIAEGADLGAVPLGSLPWPTRLGSHTTSLAVLSRACRRLAPDVRISAMGRPSSS
jgi:predicted O-methyltransferase YrrM